MPVEERPPFVIFALPRSRTAWLSNFLTYGDWFCGHDELRHLRGLDDVRSWLSQPFTGTAETGAASWWRLLVKYRPDARVVVVRRPVDEVVESLAGFGLDRTIIEPAMRRLDAKLDQIEERFPSCLSVRFEDLNREATCKRVFEFCVPYAHARERWQRLASINVQCSMPAMLRYARAYRPQIEKLASIAKHTLLAEMSSRRMSPPDGVTFQQESFDVWFDDAKELFAEHLVQVGDAPDAYQEKNIPLMRRLDELGNMQIVTARSNGRMFGYLMTIVTPSLEKQGTSSAVQPTFFASKEFPGLGLKLQRAAVEALKNRGDVKELFLRAGPRGSGPKMGVLYRRLGAVPDGELYRLQVK